MELKPSDNSMMSGAEEISASMMNEVAVMQGALYVPHDEDSTERATIIGTHLTNPYTIIAMKQAYANLGIDPAKAVVNNLYVRFLPADIDQLSQLDSLMELKGLELFDTPVDFAVEYEGDYYQDPTIPDESITWQYAVVPPSFSFPAGIQHETLAQIHIPADDYTAVETEAERLAAVQDCLNQANPSASRTFSDTLQCAPGYVWDPQLNHCVPVESPCVVGRQSNQNGVKPAHGFECAPGYEWDPLLNHCVPVVPPTCSTGYYWNGSDCVPYMQQPPAPSPDAAIPAGNIKVHDTNLDTDEGVRKARVVAKRWFKIERTYTDNSGHFQFTKRFKHKVKVNVKFKNDDAQVRNVRGFKLWQMLFPVKMTLGVFSGNKSSINYTFIQFSDYSAKGNIYWTAATVHNAVQEYRGYAPGEGIGLPPKGIKIFISKLGIIGNGGSSPMFGKRFSFSLSTGFVLSRISNAALIVDAIIGVLKGQIDIIIGYRYENANENRDISLLLSDRIKEITYHELTHAAQLSALGGSWYQTFVTAEEVEIVSNLGSGYLPYGDGSNSSSDIIALGESWAYYVGHYLADKKYTTSASCQREQDGGMAGGTTWCSNNGTNHPHLDVLENFNPNLSTDHFKWIPQGLFYDLKDDSPNELIVNGFAVNDNVKGYTNKEMFSAFKSNIFSLQDYRSKLLQQTANITSPDVPGLFSQYHY